jgi:hypothetical protein
LLLSSNFALMNESSAEPNEKRLLRPEAAVGPWTLDEYHSNAEIMLAENGEKLASIVEGIVEGRIPTYTVTLYLLSTHNKLPLAAHHRLATAFPMEDDVVQNLCTRPDVSSEILDEFADHPACFTILMTHPKTSERTLDKLADVAKLPDSATLDECESYYELFRRISVSKLESFANSEDAYLRSAVASRAKSRWIIKHLSGDAEQLVRLSAVSNPNTEMSILGEVALTDSDVYVVAAAVKRLTDLEILRKVYCRKWPTRSEELTVETALLQNPCTSPEVRMTILI